MSRFMLVLGGSVIIIVKGQLIDSQWRTLVLNPYSVKPDITIHQLNMFLNQLCS